MTTVAGGALLPNSIAVQDKLSPQTSQGTPLAFILVVIGGVLYGVAGTGIDIVLNGRGAATVWAISPIEFSAPGNLARILGRSLIVLALPLGLIRGLRYRLSLAPLLASLAPAVAMVIAGAASDGVRWAPVALLAAFAGAIWGSSPGDREWRLITRVGVGIVISAIVYIPLGGAWMVGSNIPGASTKGILIAPVLAGPFANMNSLGMTASIVAALLLRPGIRWRRSFLSLAMVVVLLSASRTAMLACFVAAGVWLLYKWSRSRMVLKWSSPMMVLAMLSLPFLNRQDGAFTGRGLIWRESLEAFSAAGNSRLYGFGPGAFNANGIVSSATGAVRYHGHNQMVTSLLVGGVVLFLALLILCFAAWITSQTDPARLVVLTLVLATAIAETPLRYDSISDHVWLAWATLFLVLNFGGVRLASRPTGESPAI